jgi:hypothetical protein
VSKGKVEVRFTFNYGTYIASNQFAVWIEDSSGKFIRTLYAPRFTATGGWEKRPDALPVWVSRSGLGSGTAPSVDAYTGATPKFGPQVFTWDCTDQDGRPVEAGEYRFFVEGTICWQDGVLYEGVITVGGGESSAAAEASYTTEAAKESDMIADVNAFYQP